MAFIFDSEREHLRKQMERFHTDQRQSAAGGSGPGDVKVISSARVQARCHLHPDKPLPWDCPECVTALRVNAMSHLQGGCIPARCFWHQIGIEPSPELVP